MTLFETTNHGVALLPLGEKGAAAKHYESTVTAGFDVEGHAHLFTQTNAETLRALQRQYGTVALWGLTVGKGAPAHAGSNTAKWTELFEGTLVAFVTKMVVVSTAHVVGRFVDDDAAAHIWSLKDDRPFSLIFVLAGLEAQQTSLRDLADKNPDIGVIKINTAVQSFCYPDPQCTSILIDALGAPDPLLVAGEELNRRVGDTDAPTTGSRRKEQPELKRTLNRENTTSQCSICGAELPKEFLRAAHIKPRTQCSETERNDIPFVGMLACTFGCDELFERRHITVTPTGGVRVSAHLPVSLESHTHLELLRTAQATSPLLSHPKRTVYLQWHNAEFDRQQTAHLSARARVAAHKGTLDVGPGTPKGNK